MWVAALFGMATKYSEGLLAVKFRSIDKDGHVLGGPFYYIERGMGKRLPQISWKWLAKIFAFFGMCVGLFGIGTFTQVNSINSAITGFFDPNKSATVSILGMDYSIATVIGSLLVAIVVGLVVIGGLEAHRERFREGHSRNGRDLRGVLAHPHRAEHHGAARRARHHRPKRLRPARC